MIDIRPSRPPGSVTAATSPTTARSRWSSTRSATSTACSTWPHEPGVRITHVLETHIHNDYVTGGLELARAHRRRLPASPAGDEVAFDRTPVTRRRRARRRGDAAAGAAHPGTHPPPPVLRPADAGGDRGRRCSPAGRCSTARPAAPTWSPEHTVELTHAQYHSVRRLAAELPDDAAVYPTHGFGSFCSATPPSGDASTIGEQRTANPALTQDEQDFVDDPDRRARTPTRPTTRTWARQRRGPAPVDLSTPEPVDPAELRRRDRRRRVGRRPARPHRVRRRAPRRHARLRAVDPASSPTSAGSSPGARPLTLIGETPEQVAEARRELVRIGIDRLAGAATGDIDALAGGHRCAPTRSRTSPTSRTALARRPVHRPRRPPRRRARRRPRRRVAAHPAARAARPPRRGARRRGLGLLRARLPRLDRRLDARPRRPRPRRSSTTTTPTPPSPGCSSPTSPRPPATDHRWAPVARPPGDRATAPRVKDAHP